MLYRCLDCKKCFSMLRNTFFSNAKLPLNEILLFAYQWLIRTPNLGLLTIFQGMSCTTATNWTNHFAQLVALDLTAIETKIGGPDVVVEIDESKFGKRMYNRGHRIEGVWVVGGVERTPERRMFVVRVDDRSAQTLMHIIHAYVAEGSIVHTDCWKGYNTTEMNKMQVYHQQVNHTLGFVDPDTGVHTNTIEGTWAGMKMKVHKRQRTKELVENHLFRIIWERYHKDRLWEQLLCAIGSTRYAE